MNIIIIDMNIMKKVWRYSVDILGRSPKSLGEMVPQLINANPVVYERKDRHARDRKPGEDDEYAADLIDQLEIFDILSLVIIFYCLDFIFINF